MTVWMASLPVQSRRAKQMMLRLCKPGTIPRRVQILAPASIRWLRVYHGIYMSTLCQTKLIQLRGCVAGD